MKKTVLMKIYCRKNVIAEKLKVVKYRSNNVTQVKCTCSEIIEPFITGDHEWIERVGEKGLQFIIVLVTKLIFSEQMSGDRY